VKGSANRKQLGRRLGLVVATAAFVLPVIAFVVAIAVVDGHASVAYFEAVAQIIPIVVLALAIELRWFAPGREVPEPLRPFLRRPELVRAIGFAYATATLLALILSEAVSLWVIADQSSGRLQLSITTAGLTAGAVALVVAILLPSARRSSHVAET
jgi:chromate transport protein ChrA